MYICIETYHRQIERKQDRRTYCIHCLSKHFCGDHEQTVSRATVLVPLVGA